MGLVLLAGRALVGCSESQKASPDPAGTAAATHSQLASSTAVAPSSEAAAVEAPTSAAVAEVPGANGSPSAPPAAAPASKKPGSTDAPIAASAPFQAAPAASGASAPPVAPAEAPAPEVDSPKTNEASFSVWMSGPATVKVGETSYATVHLSPKAPYKCNASYPYKVKLAPAPAGLTYPEPVVRGSASVAPSKTTIRVPFVATVKGKSTVQGKFSFSVCTDAQCLIESRDVSLAVLAE